jgi:hypothetical protein
LKNVGVKIPDTVKVIRDLRSSFRVTTWARLARGQTQETGHHQKDNDCGQPKFSVYLHASSFVFSASTILPVAVYHILRADTQSHISANPLELTFNALSLAQIPDARSCGAGHNVPTQSGLSFTNIDFSIDRIFYCYTI